MTVSKYSLRKMNITTPLQGTTTVVNQLDENIKVACEEIMNTVCTIDELFDIIKRNIEGNVNWKVG